MASSGLTSSDERRVPVEHRLLGLDKRSFPYALFVVAVFLLATVVVPRTNSAIDWDDPIRAGDQLAVGDGIVVTPAVGWELEAGYRLGAGGSIDGSGPVKLVSDGVTFVVEADAFDGTPADLLDQVEKVTSATDDPSFRVAGGAGTIATPSGLTGVIQSYSSVKGDGVIAAFVFGGAGVEVTAYGPPAQMAASGDEIVDMITSISPAVDASVA